MEKDIKLFDFMVNKPKEKTKTGETIKATYGDYSGVLYGQSSMAIYDKDGHEVMHTGFRTEHMQTKEDLIECLKAFPEYLENLRNHIVEIKKDTEEDESDI